uniref:Sulfhydryl oxidase n=1 Tax=Panthera tigris altaica TaxID=74533 RepID=A0A8C9KIW7_PANTA
MGHPVWLQPSGVRAFSGPSVGRRAARGPPPPGGSAHRHLGSVQVSEDPGGGGAATQPDGGSRRTEDLQRGLQRGCAGFAEQWVRQPPLGGSPSDSHGAKGAYFKAFTKEFITGENFKGPDRELQTVRRTMIDFLQNHTDGHRPPACPPLGPVRPSDILSLLDSRDGRYVAILFESNSSYVGREVILDLLPYENIVVKRALDTDKAFLEKLGVSSVPSCYLIYPNGSHGLININPCQADPTWSRSPGTALPWEASSRTTSERASFLAQLFPGRAPVRKLLETLQEWLASLPLDRIPYNAVLDLANNKMRWVGCQGSRPEFRGYTCALWKLFHTLTVQAGAHPEALDGTAFEGDPQAVLQSIRRYVRTFFGCKECAEHFEELARESMGSVKTADQATLWLWKQHNFVNNRLAGEQKPQRGACPAAHVPMTPDLCHREPRGDPRAESARPPSVLPPRPRLSEGSQLGLDGRLQSVSWAEGRREAEAVVPFLGMGFSSLDMSLCVVLYVASSLFLMMMYFFFRVRSKRWKVRHHRPSV